MRLKDGVANLRGRALGGWLVAKKEVRWEGEEDGE